LLAIRQNNFVRVLVATAAAAVLFNSHGGGSAPISVSFDELQYQGVPALASAKNCHVKSVWEDGAGESGVFSGQFEAAVNGSAVFFAIISGCDA
jgi:hypothetical protein